MKKILLLLSCFLATWCSVQAASPYGVINSASYDATNSQINAYFTSRNAYKVELGYISQHAGSLDKPLYKKSFGVIDGATSWATIDVAPNLEAGQYVVLMYLNDSKTANGGTQTVNVTARAAIKGFSPNLNNTQLTVNYCILHSSPTYTYLKVYDGKTLVKNSRVSNSFNGNCTFDTSSLTPGKTYTFRVYNQDKILTEKKYTLPLPTGDFSVAYTPNNKTITIDYVLKYDRKPTLEIYDHWNGSLVTKVTIPNSASRKNYKIENIQLKDNYRYDVVICDNGVKTEISQDLSTTAVETNGAGYSSNQITNLWYDRSTNKINVDFCLKRSSATVGFRLLSTKSGRWYEGGSWYCPQNCGSYFIDVPNETGNVLYIVVLTINGTEDGATKQIVISR